MKLITIYDDGAPDHEYDNFTIEATNDNGETQGFSIGSGEPEDMYLFRELGDALTVPELMRMAYEAGKAGEEFEIEERKPEEE